MATEATGKATCERPVFAPHPYPGDVKTMLGLVQDGYRQHIVAMESLVGCPSMGYPTKTVNIDEIFIKARFIEVPEVPKKTADASRQGTGAESERMAHIFTERAEQAKYVAVEDILDMASSHWLRKSPRKSSRVLVVGRAGSGKTMSFARKAAFDWSRGKLWPQIDLLFVPSLKEEGVRKAETLHDLIRLEHLGIMGKTKVEIIRSYIGDNWDRVCILFDGLDEVKLNTCSDFFQKIIQGQALTQAHVVVTSRPSNEAMILDRDYPFKTRLELVGFGRKERDEYAAMVLKKDHAPDFLRQVNSCPPLAALLQSPLHCAIACASYRTDNKVTAVNIVNGVVQHAQGKYRNADPALTEISAWFKASFSAAASPCHAFTAADGCIPIFWSMTSKHLELSQHSRALDRPVNNENIDSDNSPHIVLSGQIPKETSVTSSAKLLASSTSQAVTALSSSHDGPSSQNTLSAPSTSSFDGQQRMKEDQPFDVPVFAAAYPMLCAVDPVQLRLHAFEGSLISRMELTELQVIQSPMAHTEKFINYIRPGGEMSFKKLLKVLGEMGPNCIPVRQKLEDIRLETAAWT